MIVVRQLPEIENILIRIEIDKAYKCFENANNIRDIQNKSKTLTLSP